MVATKLVAKNREIDQANTFSVDDELSLLKSAAVYGANASGKSNLAKSLSFMKWFMINSSKETQSTDVIGVEPFRLSTDTENEPSHFEIVFMMDGQRYRYGFEARQDKIVKEWLFYVPKSRETNLFKRELGEIRTSKKYGSDGLQKITRSNALFLSVSAQFNVKIAEKILHWISHDLHIISGLRNESYLDYTVSCLLNKEYENEILQLVKNLDLGIDSISIKQHDLKPIFDSMPDLIKSIFIEASSEEDKATSVVTRHKKFDRDRKYKSNEFFDLKMQESDGTFKLFTLSGLIVNALKNGLVLVVDELDARLHPQITREIVKLFNSKKSNLLNAQLIFMTHDINLLDNELFRRDQIWFTNKNRYGESDLYSLAEYKVRNDASFEDDYMRGRYGAVPYAHNLGRFLLQEDGK